MPPSPTFFLEGMQENSPHSPVLEESSASLEEAAENPPHSFHSLYSKMKESPLGSFPTKKEGNPHVLNPLSSLSLHRMLESSLHSLCRQQLLILVHLFSYMKSFYLLA